MDGPEPQVGRTHWDIFLASFRRNRAAVVAFWICLILLYVAAYTPLVCNNRPIVMQASAPGVYARTYQQVLELVRSELVPLPASVQERTAGWQEWRGMTVGDLRRDLSEQAARLENALEIQLKQARVKVPSWAVRFDSGAMTLGELGLGAPEPSRLILERIRDEVLRKSLDSMGEGLQEGPQSESFQRLRRGLLRCAVRLASGAQAGSPMDVPVVRAAFRQAAEEARPHLLPEHQAQLDRLMEGVEQELSRAFHPLPQEARAVLETCPRLGPAGVLQQARQTARRVMASVGLRLRAMRQELTTQRARPVRERVIELEGYDEDAFLLAAGEERVRRLAQLEQWCAAFAQELDPRTAALRSRLRFPGLETLRFYDAFFMLAGLLLALAFGPLHWWWLRRLPQRRRVRLRAAIVLVPSALAAVAWAVWVRPTFETRPYREAIEQGDYVVSWAVWPWHPWDYRDVVVRAEEAKTQEGHVKMAQPPSWQRPLGTDLNGRDMLARMLWGSRISLTIGFISSAIAFVIGVTLGALAGYYKGWLDSLVLMRMTEWFMCFPAFFVVITVAFYFKANMFAIMAFIGLFSWMGIMRLVRGEFLRLGNQDFVTAARALGASSRRIMFRHVLPNALGPALIAVSFGVATAILTESALGFLGFGVQEPIPSWGSLLNQGRGGGEPWLILPAGFAIFLTVTCYNLVGDGIRDAIDPRLKV